MHHAVNGVPLFREHDGVLAAAHGRQQYLVDEVRRKAAGVVLVLAPLAVVHAGRVVAADPLRPPVQVQRSVHLVPGQRRIADEPQVRVEAEIRECSRQAVCACGKPAGSRVGIRSFERQDMELHSVTTLAERFARRDQQKYVGGTPLVLECGRARRIVEIRLSRFG